jgi:ABC-type transporter Mla subunit MlaD
MSDQTQNQGGQQQAAQGQSDQVIHNQLDAARHLAEQQIDSAIDQLAQKVPGGTQYTQQAKDAASSVLDKLEGELEQEAEKRLGNLGGMLGGLFGHHQDKQENQH